MIGYFNGYIPAYPKLTLPFTQLLTGKSADKIEWTENLENVFVRLNQVIAEHALLKAHDFNKEFVLYTDASYNTVAGALLQRNESEKLHPVIYVVWKL